AASRTGLAGDAPASNLSGSTLHPHPRVTSPARKTQEPRRAARSSLHSSGRALSSAKERARRILGGFQRSGCCGAAEALKALFECGLRLGHHVADDLTRRLDGVDQSRALPAGHPAFFGLALVAGLLCQRESILRRLNRERFDLRLAADP